MFEMHSQVVLAVALPALRLEPGAVGVVVHVHGQGEACEVEFMTPDGQTIGVETVRAADLRQDDEQDAGPLTDCQLAAVRQDAAAHMPTGRLINSKGLFDEQSEFVRRGLASIARSEADGDWIPADTVLSKLEAKVAATNERLRRNPPTETALDEVERKLSQ